MSVCGHNAYCTGEGAAHDAATLGREGLRKLRGQSKKLLRSGNPFKRAVGKALGERVAAAWPLAGEGDDE